MSERPPSVLTVWRCPACDYDTLDPWPTWPRDKCILVCNCCMKPTLETHTYVLAESL